MDLAKRLQQLRKRAELTQTELADKAGVSQQLVAKIERGKVRESKKLVRLAGAFGMTVEEFLSPISVLHFEADDYTEKSVREHLPIYSEDEAWSRLTPEQKRLAIKIAQLMSSETEPHTLTPEPPPKGGNGKRRKRPRA